MDEILNYLAKAEGTHIHWINGEKVPTLPYGIYNKPDSKMHQYIIELAEQNDLAKPFNQWTEADIDFMNILVDHTGGIRSLAKDFYEQYLKSAHLDLFPKECQVAMYSMYTTSQKGTWQSVQQAILDMIHSNKIGLLKGEVSLPDGDFGKKTEKSLKYIKKHSNIDPYYFEALMLSNMKTYYAELAVRNPSKYLDKLRGWNNRINKLQMMK